MQTAIRKNKKELILSIQALSLFLSKLKVKISQIPEGHFPPAGYSFCLYPYHHSSVQRMTPASVVSRVSQRGERPFQPCVSGPRCYREALSQCLNVSI